jgi:hypothetical protein
MHKHHIIPRHLGGTDAPSNLIELTIEEHAEIHKQLWLMDRRWQDEIAYLVLSGQIAHEEATILAIKKAQTGRKRTPEENIRMHQATIGKKKSEQMREKSRINGFSNKSRIIKLTEGGIKTRFQPGMIVSEEKRKAQSILMKGKPKTSEQKLKMSLAAKMRWNKTKVG